MKLNQIWGLDTILKPELHQEMSLFFSLQCSGIIWDFYCLIVLFWGFHHCTGAKYATVQFLCI